MNGLAIPPTIILSMESQEQPFIFCQLCLFSLRLLFTRDWSRAIPSYPLCISFHSSGRIPSRLMDYSYPFRGHYDGFVGKLFLFLSCLLHLWYILLHVELNEPKTIGASGYSNKWTDSDKVISWCSFSFSPPLFNTKEQLHTNCDHTSPITNV